MDEAFKMTMSGRWLVVTMPGSLTMITALVAGGVAEICKKLSAHCYVS